MAGRTAVCRAVLIVAISTVLVAGQFTITRNLQDCVYPAIATDHFSLWPTKAYLPTATSIRALPGGFRVQSSAGFRIDYYGTYKVITNILASESYVLYACGTAKPTVTGAAKVFMGPLVSVSVNDAGGADYMAQQLLTDRVAFATDLSVSGCLQALAGCGYVAPDTYSSDDLDKIKNKVDAFLTYAATSYPQTIAFTAPAARSPLERAKWLQYVGAFFNKEDAANTLYLAIRDSYNTLKRAVKNTRAADSTLTQPFVCWVYQDWEGDYAMSYADYKAAYIRDAGGVMFAKADLLASGMVAKPPGSLTTFVYPNNYTNVAAAWGGVLQSCDIIIDESYNQATGGLTLMSEFLTVHGLTDYADQLPAVTNKLVYTVAGTTGMPVTSPTSPYRGSVGLDWFERGVSRPDEVLRDFVKVITPTVPAVSGATLRWLLRLDGVQAQQRVSAVCTLPTAKLDANCRRGGYSTRICPSAVRNCDTGVVEYPADAFKRCVAVSNQDRARRLKKRQGLPECAPETSVATP